MQADYGFFGAGFICCNFNDCCGSLCGSQICFVVIPRVAILASLSVNIFSLLIKKKKKKDKKKYHVW